jgi:Nop53 (60S ribosomal biogenesis)
LLASISNAKQLRKANSELLSIQEEEREQKQFALVEKLRKQGLAGQKLGKHKVPESELAVQLGEDLSDSLRGLKVSWLCCCFFFCWMLIWFDFFFLLKSLKAIFLEIDSRVFSRGL